MDGYQVPGIYELVIIKCVYFCIFTKVPGTPCGFKKKHHICRSWLSLSFQVCRMLHPRGHAFHQRFGFRSGSREGTSLGGEHGTLGLKQLQPSRGGRWCCAKRGAFLHDPYTMHEWWVRVYVPIHEFGWFFVVKLVGTYTVYQSHGWYGLITRNWN